MGHHGITSAIRKDLGALAVFAIALAACSAAYAQPAFPLKPLRIVTAAPGGGADYSARILAQGLTDALGQQVVVDNRGGGNGIIAAQTVMKSPPDGHTMLLYPSPMWLLPFLQNNVPYDPVKDFAPITLIDSAPALLAVHPSLPVRSVRELIALARSRPNELNYSRASAGSQTHLASELLNKMAGIKIMPVPYKGGGPAIHALLAGEVEMSFVAIGATSAMIKANRIRALAVTSTERSRLFPDVPTMAASGLPGFEALLTNGLFAPAGTPAHIISKLNQEVAQVLRRPEIRELLLNGGVDPVGNSPDAFAAFVKSEMAKWGPLIKSAGIRGN